MPPQHDRVAGVYVRLDRSKVVAVYWKSTVGVSDAWRQDRESVEARKPAERKNDFLVVSRPGAVDVVAPLVIQGVFTWCE